MAQTITLTQSAYKEILNRLSRLERLVVKVLKSNYVEPAYGSSEWWEWSNKKAMDDIKRGDYYELRDEKELKDFFDNIDKVRSNKKYDHKVRQASRKTSKQTAKAHIEKVAQTATATY